MPSLNDVTKVGCSHKDQKFRYKGTSLASFENLTTNLKSKVNPKKIANLRLTAGTSEVFIGSTRAPLVGIIDHNKRPQSLFY